MREDPGLDVDKISACLQAHYSLRVTSVTFLPIGYDPNAAVYEVPSCDGGCYFLKVRFGPVHEPSLLVPRTLTDLGIPNVLVGGDGRIHLIDWDVPGLSDRGTAARESPNLVHLGDASPRPCQVGYFRNTAGA